MECNLTDEFSEKYDDKITIEWDDGTGIEKKINKNNQSAKIELPKKIKVTKTNDCDWPKRIDGSSNIEVTDDGGYVNIEAIGCPECEAYNKTEKKCTIDNEKMVPRVLQKQENNLIWHITPIANSFCLKISDNNTSSVIDGLPTTVTIGEPLPPISDKKKEKKNSDGAESVQR